MVALMGGDDGARDALDGLDDVWVANINGPGQIVVSGTRAGLDDLLARHKELGWRRATPLPGRRRVPLPAHGAGPETNSTRRSRASSGARPSPC